MAWGRESGGRYLALPFRLDGGRVPTSDLADSIRLFIRVVLGNPQDQLSSTSTFYVQGNRATTNNIAFDGIHDEIAVTSPLAQAILSFRGAANGEEAPLRVIQGNKTMIKGVGATGKVSIDPVHDEIFLATPDQTILTFNRLDNGNVEGAACCARSAPELDPAELTPQRRTHWACHSGARPRRGREPGIHPSRRSPSW